MYVYITRVLHWEVGRIEAFYLFDPSSSPTGPAIIGNEMYCLGKVSSVTDADVRNSNCEPECLWYASYLVYLCTVVSNV